MKTNELSKEIIEFIEWLGENYVKLYGGWIPKYGSQIQPTTYGTALLYEVYKRNYEINSNQ